MSDIPPRPSWAPEFEDRSDPTPSLKASALNRDIRIGRVQVFHTLAIDLAELVRDPQRDLRVLQRLRAADRLFAPLRARLIENVPSCFDEAERYIRPRMRDSVELGGKAVWTDQFLERFAPIGLPTPEHLLRNRNKVGRDRRLSDNPTSPLHYVRFKGADMKMFRDGTITYTLRTVFDDDPSSAVHQTRKNPPASIAESIVRIEAVDNLLAENFRIALSDLLRLSGFRVAVAQSTRVGGPDWQEEGLQLVDPSALQAPDLERRSEEHRTIFVESFFDATHAERLSQDGGRNFEEARVSLQTVLSSAALAGLLNTASWYDHYNARYVHSLGQREIGYRDDEIYLTDRKSTVISAGGFWRDESADGAPPDPLTRYKWDIVLAAEYNVARLAYLASTLTYYQTHADVRGLEGSKPLTALNHVIDGRSILSHIDESLDLSLLVDHGFTRLFIRRLRDELGVDEAIGFIRGRVADASTSVGLKSAVLSAENTSKESLKTSLASLDVAQENNRLQRKMVVWAVAAVVVTALSFVAGLAAQSWVERDRQVIVCVTSDDGKINQARCSQDP